ncbi:MFS transporter [Paludibacterium paludis]|uniref:Sugar transporter n=1 Tax=Paludibacterium paludis TaxID=1225769 RepID=A0A918UBT6_9NEIS|nr:MFS transporter [Paludibacterium paludis]GGY25886.1 sugar transporter [Paludibacterium paludis]
MTAKPPHALPNSLVFLMAMATGLAVACNYYAQPLLHTLAGEFHLSVEAAGALVTAAQLGYAAGLLLLVPLGDLFEKRRLIVTLCLLTAASLAMTALAPNFAIMLAGTALTGFFAVLAQVLIPMAATLASAEERGRVVGRVMSGLLMGILLARTVAGAVSSLASWRAVYVIAALSMLLMALALRRALPCQPPTGKLAYPRLIFSVFALLIAEPVLRMRAVLGALAFAIFSVLWTSMAFLLAAAPYHYNDATIGMFGLVGAVGALAAAKVGRMADQGRSSQSTSLGFGLLLLSWLPLAFGEVSLTALILGIILLDLAIQGVHISNQSQIYRSRPEARSRITAAYMTSNFIGAAAGSLMSAAAYGQMGWQGVALSGAALSLAGCVYWGWQLRQSSKHHGVVT